jgi:hypothetical protein
MTEKEMDIICRLVTHIQKGDVSNDFLVQLIELSGSFLNIKTRSEYAKENEISYNGAKHHRCNVKLFGVNFIIDND